MTSWRRMTSLMSDHLFTMSDQHHGNILCKFQINNTNIVFFTNFFLSRGCSPLNKLCKLTWNIMSFETVILINIHKKCFSSWNFYYNEDYIEHVKYFIIEVKKTRLVSWALSLGVHRRLIRFFYDPFLF